MNKRELIAEVAGRLSDKEAAAEAVDAVLDTIQTTVARGEHVRLIGFGTFEKQHKPARDGVHPTTREPIRVPAKSVPKFIPGADFRGRVASGA